MSKEVIKVNGQKRAVREDTAKSFRGVHWALLSLLAFVLIAGLLFLAVYLQTVSDHSSWGPFGIEQSSIGTHHLRYI